MATHFGRFARTEDYSRDDLPPVNDAYHNNSTTRDDSSFWNYCRNMPVRDSLTEKVELFRPNGQIFREDDELFAETSWAAVIMGQAIQMGNHNAMADAVREPTTRNEIDAM